MSLILLPHFLLFSCFQTLFSLSQKENVIVSAGCRGGKTPSLCPHSSTDSTNHVGEWHHSEVLRPSDSVQCLSSSCRIS